MPDSESSSQLQPRWPPWSVLLLWLGGGLAFGTIAALQVYWRPGDRVAFWWLLLLHVPHWVGWMVFALLVWFALHRFGTSRRRQAVALVVLCPIVICAHAAFVAAWDLVVLNDRLPVAWTTIVVRHLEGSTLLEVLGYVIMVVVTALALRRRLLPSGVERSHDATPPALVIRSSNTIDRVPLTEIRLVEASGNYVRILAGTRLRVMRSTLTALEAELDERFVRVHRSRIVNREHVVRLHSRGRHRRWAELRNGQRVKVSPNGWRTLDRILSASAAGDSG